MKGEQFTLRDEDEVVQMAGSIDAQGLQGALRIYQHGDAQASIGWVDGRQEGPCVILHGPHRPMARTNYVAGRLHGLAEYFGPEGNLVRKCAYRHGLLHGVQVDYYPDGTPFEQSIWRDGVLEGAWQRHHPDGAVAERRTYAAGRAVVLKLG